MAKYPIHLGSVVPTGAVNCAFVFVPPLVPGENVGLVDLHTGVSNNADKIETEIKNPSPVTAKHIWITYHGWAGLGDSWIASGNPNIYPSGVELSKVCKPMRVLGVHVDDTGAWYPLISDGTLIRKYTMGSDYPTTGWLRNAGYEDDDELVLFYAVPEMRTRTVWEHSLACSANSKIFTVVNELAQVVASNKLQLYNKNIRELNEIIINDQSTLGGVMPASATNTSGVSSIDGYNGIITLSRSVAPEDIIQVSYKFIQDAYVYRGFVYSGYYEIWKDKPFEGGRAEHVFMPLDLNPQPGHIYGDSTSGIAMSQAGINKYSRLDSSNLLDRVIYIYAEPAAAYRESDLDADKYLNIVSIFDTDPDKDGEWESKECVWASVIKHYIEGRDYGKAADQELNTYGHCYFGDGHFDGTLPGGFEGGLHDNPVALVLAKLYVGPNSTAEGVRVVDTRTPGGGLPEDINEDELKGPSRVEAMTFWDIGGWEGEPYAGDGVAYIQVASGLISGTAEEEIQEAVGKHIAAGVHAIVTRPSGGS